MLDITVACLTLTRRSRRHTVDWVNYILYDMDLTQREEKEGCRDEKGKTTHIEIGTRQDHNVTRETALAPLAFRRHEKSGHGDSKSRFHPSGTISFRYHSWVMSVNSIVLYYRHVLQASPYILVRQISKSAARSGHFEALHSFRHKNHI